MQRVNQAKEQEVQEVTPEQNQERQPHCPVIRSETFTDSNLAKKSIDARENIKRRKFYRQSRFSKAPPFGSDRGSGGDHGRDSGSLGSGCRQSRLYTEIGRAVSILKDMENGPQISCSDEGCWA